MNDQQKTVNQQKKVMNDKEKQSYEREREKQVTRLYRLANSAKFNEYQKLILRYLATETEDGNEHLVWDFIGMGIGAYNSVLEILKKGEEEA